MSTNAYVQSYPVKLWIFNHYAQGPDLPGGTRHYDLAKALVNRGHNVTIFAAGYHYTLLEETMEYANGLYKIEIREGMRFVWIKTFPYRKNDFRRLINIVSYAWRLYCIVPKLELGNPDIVIGSVVHPFAPLVAAKFARRYDVPFVYEIRDLWPQTFIDMGVWSEKGLKSRFFKYLETISVAKSKLIITLSPDTKAYIHQHYGEKAILYLPNGVDLTAFEKNYCKHQNIASDRVINRLKTLKKHQKFIALFTGAIVQSNNIDLFLRCAEQLKNARIHIVLVGKGMERSKYEARIAAAELDNIELLDPVKKTLVPVLLRTADALMLVQGKVHWGSMNKLFDYMAAGRPILTALYAGHNNVVSQAHCGLAADPENAADFTDKLETLAAMPLQQLQTLGQNAIEYVAKNHSIDTLADGLEAALVKLIVEKGNR